MSKMVLFHFPGACSRVVMNALEEIGVPYEDRVVNIIGGAQKSAEYLATNPKGKVPALRVDEQVYTENAAILHWLNSRFPQARLLPQVGSGVGDNECIEDLIWCSSTVHPLVRQVRMPIRFTDGDPSGVQAHGMKTLPAILHQIAARVSGARWWYEGGWSILDVYLYWNYSTAASAGLDLSPWPALLDHGSRVRERPSFARALARETAALAQLGIELPPGASL